MDWNPAGAVLDAVDGSFLVRPSVVSAFDDEVDFFAAMLAYVTFVNVCRFADQRRNARDFASRPQKIRCGRCVGPPRRPLKEVAPTKGIVRWNAVGAGVGGRMLGSDSNWRRVCRRRCAECRRKSLCRFFGRYGNRRPCRRRLHHPSRCKGTRPGPKCRSLMLWPSPSSY